MSTQDQKSPIAARLTLEDVATIVSKQSIFRDAEILKFNLKPFSAEPLGYLGVHELLSVEARECNDDNNSGKIERLTFFVKSKGPSAVEFDELIFREESKFFRELVPKLLDGYKQEAWAAECYLVKDNSLLVLEDLRARGFGATNRPLELDELRSAIGSVARFHACSLLLEKKLGKPLNEAYPGFFREKVFVKDDVSAWKWLATGIELVKALARDMGLDDMKIPVAYDLVLKKILPMITNKKEGDNNVMCHLDLWFNNLVFEKESSHCRLVDFQMVAYTSYAIDLAEIVYLNTRVEVRKKIERELVGLYHEVLTESLKLHGYEKNIDFEEVWQNYEEKRICGLVAAVQFLPIALWGKEMAAKYADPDQCLYYMYTNRHDLVREAMKEDENYRVRIEETVRDLVIYMDCRQGR